MIDERVGHHQEPGIAALPPVAVGRAGLCRWRGGAPNARRFLGHLLPVLGCRDDRHSCLPPDGEESWEDSGASPRRRRCSPATDPLSSCPREVVRPVTPLLQVYGRLPHRPGSGWIDGGVFPRFPGQGPSVTPGKQSLHVGQVGCQTCSCSTRTSRDSEPRTSDRPTPPLPSAGGARRLWPQRGIAALLAALGGVAALALEQSTAAPAASISPAPSDPPSAGADGGCRGTRRDRASPR